MRARLDRCIALGCQGSRPKALPGSWLPSSSLTGSARCGVGPVVWSSCAGRAGATRPPTGGRAAFGTRAPSAVGVPSARESVDAALAPSYGCSAGPWMRQARRIASGLSSFSDHAEQVAVRVTPPALPLPSRYEAQAVPSAVLGILLGDRDRFPSVRRLDLLPIRLEV